MSTECSFDLNGLVIKGLRWGEGNPHKVIALHGWLDNAASFSLLAPHLRNLDVAQSILSLRDIETRPRSYYHDYEKAALARTKGFYPLSEEASRLLAARSLVHDKEKGYYWRYDKRLLVASEIKLSEPQVKAFIDALPCVAKVILAKGGYVDQGDFAWVYEHNHLLLF